MNPAFITTSFLHTQQNSGISNALYLVVKHLHDKRCVKSTVFVPVQAWGKNNVETDFVSVKRFSISSFLNYNLSLSMKNIIEKEGKNNFDFIHSYHYGFFPATAPGVPSTLATTVCD